MSISSALSNALTGLTASARAAGVVSTNLANVLTDGYAVRDIELTTQGDGRGGGVSVVGITRKVDAGLLSERRSADSDLAFHTTLSGFSARLETEIGTPDDPGSLNARISALEASLSSASTKPEEEARLNEVALSAEDLAKKLNDVSDRIQRERTSADGQIEQAVKRINTLLEQAEALNAQIMNARNTGHPTASFEDQRQQVVDQLSEYVPLRIAERGNGAMALYTPGGAILLDGKAAEFSFSASNLVAPHMTLQNGLISGLEINGVSMVPSGEGSPIVGGKLSALFEIRDGLMPDAQTQVDAIARDLIERFQQPGLDATRAAGDPGLFTDSGTLFDPLDEIGIAGRISFNDTLNPANGGDAWRLRDGLNAVGPGPVGSSALLSEYAATLSTRDALVSGDLGVTERSFAGHSSTLLSHVSQMRLTIDQNVSFAATRQSGLIDLELQQGVDSDEQLQKLLLLEQAYAANARMIQTVDELLQTLLRI